VVAHRQFSGSKYGRMKIISRCSRCPNSLSGTNKKIIAMAEIAILTMPWVSGTPILIKRQQQYKDGDAKR
jgi:hypothetical protein